MKSKKSIIKKNSIAILILIVVAVISGVKTLSKEISYRELKVTEQEYLSEIRKLKEVKSDKEKDLNNVDTLEFVEKFAREKLKMVKPNEVYFIINYSEDDLDE